MKHYQIRQSITDRSSISVDLYLKDIAKYPLLTEDEEKELVKKIENGDKKAKEQLINSNLRFVVSIAKQYQGKGIDLADLIACGNIGLLTAIDQFKLSFNCRFVSYAGWWIRDYILKELLTNRMIKIPTDKLILLNKVEKVSNKFEQENERPPTIDELSSILNMSEDDINSVLNFSRISIIQDNTTDQDGKSESIYDTLFIDDGNTDLELKKSSRSFEIHNILKTVLNPIEYRVITRIFGLNGIILTFDEIANECNITKERVRQIKDKAIIKLRKSVDIKDLQKYL